MAGSNNRVSLRVHWLSEQQLRYTSKNRSPQDVSKDKPKNMPLEQCPISLTQKLLATMKRRESGWQE